jgi:hypothetical protein
MSEAKKLLSNEFWGRRSGSLMKAKEGLVGVFKQMQWGSGSSGSGKKNHRTDKSPRLNSAWFGKDYKTKEQKNAQRHKKSKKKG